MVELYGAEQMSDWIKCTDRLPAIDETVIICDAGVVSVGCYLGTYEGDAVWDYIDREAAYNVTHWMKLPKAP
jgi:hypothetical protein